MGPKKIVSGSRKKRKSTYEFYIYYIKKFIVGVCLFVFKLLNG